MKRTMSAKQVIPLILALAAGTAMLCSRPRTASAHPFDQTYESAVEALEAYRVLIKDYPEDLELHYLLGSMLIKARELDEAEERFNYVIEKKPDYDMAWYKLAEVYYRKENYERAFDMLQHMKDETLEDDKLIAEATIYLKLEKPEKALEVSEKAIEIDELNPGGWLHLGLANRDLGNPDRAIELILKSLKMDPGQPLVYDWFMELLYDYRNRDEQIDLLTELYKAIPYDSATARRIHLDIYTLKKKDGEE